MSTPGTAGYAPRYTVTRGLCISILPFFFFFFFFWITARFEKRVLGNSRMANDNILCAIMRSHNTCDIMRYYALLCAIMRYYAPIMRRYALIMCRTPHPPTQKKSLRSGQKCPKPGGIRFLGYKWAYGVVFIDFRGVSLIYYLLHVF